MKVEGTNIKMVRGDSESLSVYCIGQDKIIVPLVAGDKVYFTVKLNIHETDKIFQKVVTTFTNGKALIKILPADTKSLQYMSYVYDVQIVYANGDVNTIIPPSKFIIGGEVTYE